jgi:hypothetical protein
MAAVQYRAVLVKSGGILSIKGSDRDAESEADYNALIAFFQYNTIQSNITHTNTTTHTHTHTHTRTS